MAHSLTLALTLTFNNGPFVSPFQTIFVVSIEVSKKSILHHWMWTVEHYRLKNPMQKLVMGSIRHQVNMDFNRTFCCFCNFEAVTNELLCDELALMPIFSSTVNLNISCPLVYKYLNRIDISHAKQCLSCECPSNFIIESRFRKRSRKRRRNKKKNNLFQENGSHIFSSRISQIFLTNFLCVAILFCWDGVLGS